MDVGRWHIDAVSQEHAESILELVGGFGVPLESLLLLDTQIALVTWRFASAWKGVACGNSYSLCSGYI